MRHGKLGFLEQYSPIICISKALCENDMHTLQDERGNFYDPSYLFCRSHLFTILLFKDTKSE